MTAVICPECGFGGDLEDENPAFPYDWENNLCWGCSRGENVSTQGIVESWATEMEEA